MSAALAACDGEQYPQTTFRTVTEFGDLLNELFANTFWWTMAVLVLVCVLLVYVVIRFRERPGQPTPKQIHGNTKLELLWTTIPAIIVVFIAVPTVAAIFETQRRAPPDALLVEVIGHQWWWEFRYPEQGVVTANQLYLPVNRLVHLRMHSADVIHSFWIPRFGGKRDVNPPAATAEGERHAPNHLLFTIDEPGTYSGQCAEFCGASHAIMMMTAVAVQPDEFDRWIESMRDAGIAPQDTAQAVSPGAQPVQQPPGQAVPVPPPAPPGQAQSTQADTGRAGAQARQQAQATPPPRSPTPSSPLADEGRRIFLSRSCIACHAISNTTAAGALGPNLTRFATRPTIGAGALPNTPENLERWIRHPRSVKPSALMPGTQEGAPPPGNPGGPPFPATGLTDQEVRAVAAYLSSLR